MTPEGSVAAARLATLCLAAPGAWLAWRVSRGYAAAADRPGPRWAAPALIGVFVWAGVATHDPWILAASLTLGWALTTLAAIDITCLRLPDALTLPLLAAGVLIAAALPGRPILDHLVAAAVGYGALAGLAFAWRRWRGIDGIGLGDAKLLAAGGAWLGWRPLPAALLVACLLAFAWVGVRVAIRGRPALSERLAFGAPLCLAIWTVWLNGPPAM